MLVLSFLERDRAAISLAGMTVEQFLAVRDQPIWISLECKDGEKQRIGFDAPRCIGVDREPVFKSKRLAAPAAAAAAAPEQGGGK